MLCLILSIVPAVSAEDLKHNVGVVATSDPLKIHMGIKPTEDNSLTFHVDIYNSGDYVEEGIALQITEAYTGHVIYSNSEQVSLLPAGEHALFDIVIPFDRLSNSFYCSYGNSWFTEYYQVKVVQKAYEYDSNLCNNFYYTYAFVKPYCKGI